MNTQKNSHIVTGSPLLAIGFIIGQTLLWGAVLCLADYFIWLFISVIRQLLGLPTFPPFHSSYYIIYRIRALFDWPFSIVTAFVITLIRAFLRKTKVTVGNGTVCIRRPGREYHLYTIDFLRKETTEKLFVIHNVPWISKKHYLIFKDAAQQELSYRLYGFTADNLDRVVRLILQNNKDPRVWPNYYMRT